MLIDHEDLRNRLIRLAGYGRLTIATRALDDAVQRISRYLQMQSIINGSCGVAVALGYFLIGVPYAFFWGFLAATLRFIPYVGPVLAAVPSLLTRQSVVTLPSEFTQLSRARHPKDTFIDYFLGQLLLVLACQA